MALRQNIIYIYFKGKHQVTSKSQYQYNRKQYLYFVDLNLPQVFEVHFSNRDKGESKTQIGNDKLVEIPDEYFWNGALQIYAWIYLHSGANDSETIYEIRIPLTKRAKPTDEEPLPVQQSAIDKAIAELNNAVNVTTENVNKTESDKIIVANIKDEVVDLKEDIDSTAATINQKAQDAIDASGRAETSALNAADSERKALNYSQQAEQSAQEALESKNIAKQKAEIATGASAEALGYRDEAVNARDIAVQAKQNIVDYRDETKGYRDETLNLKNNVQTLKNQIDETAEEIEDISDSVKEDAQSASQSASSANQSSINASESASQAGQFADGAEQSANQAEQSMNMTEDYKNQSETYKNQSETFKNQSETFKNQAEQFKNQSETNVSHYPKIVNDYWYVWDATNGEYINTNVDANGIKGDTGNGIASVALNDDYTLTITFTDDTTYTTSSIRGQQGEKGDTGRTGESGVYIGTEEPENEDIKVWIDIDESADSGTVEDLIADITDLKEDLRDLKSGFTDMTTATSADVGKALKAKTVTDGKVTEWEFGEAGGGEDYYTETPSLNLCDSSEWTDANSSPLLPAEYGKIYSSNINTYAFNTRVYDANKTSLGALNAYGGVTVTKGTYYDGVSFKYTYEVTDEAIAYIQFRITKPDIPNSVPMWLEGNVNIPVIPIAYDDTSLSPIEPALGDLKSVMLSNHKVARAELDADLSNAIKVLGYSDKVVQASDIYNFDASTSELLVYDGVIQGKEGVTAYSNAEFLFFDSAVNRISYDFRSGTSALSPWVIVKDNFESEGRILSLYARGIGYLYRVSTDGTVSALSNSFAWTAENPLVSVDIVRNTDNIVLTFVDSTDAEIVKTYTFAQLRITGDAGRMGMYPRRTTSTIRNKALACVNLKIGAKASISGGGSSASRLAEKTWDAWGDSFTAGDSSYPSKVATATGCTATNLGQSGDKVATVLGRFNDRADACGSYVTVFAGVNDFLYATALETFKTNVQSMITAVITKAPSSKFGWIIPPQTSYQQTNSLDLTLEDYDNAIIEICRANSVPVLDLYHEGGWYTNSAFTSIYIGGDGLHPSAVGQALLADKIQSFLERL